MKISFPQYLQEQEELIHKGNGHEVQKNLLLLKKLSIPREFRASLANIARRVRRPYLALRLLNPYIRTENPAHAPVSDKEILEYAAPLTFIGAAQESIDLLKKVSSRAPIEKNLYLAFAYFSMWQYKESIAPLEHYVQSQEITSYQKLVGQVNLAQAYLSSQMPEKAKQLLDTIYRESKKNKYQLLLAFVLDLYAQYYVQSQEPQYIPKILNEAIQWQVSMNSGGLTNIIKWQAVGEIYQGQTSKGVELLSRAQSLAQQHFQWEAMRDCDFYRSLACGDLELFQKVYWGTPYPSYRQNHLSIFKERFGPLPISSDPEYLLGKKNYSEVLNLNTGEFECAQFPIRQTPLHHHLLKVLASDVYRPLRVATLWHHLYPKDYFNPYSSPHTIHQHIYQLRRTLDENDLGLKIKSEKGAYRLTTEKGIIIRPSLSFSEHHEFYSMLAKTHDLFGEQLFTLKELSHTLKKSKWSLYPFLTWAKEENVIITHGNGKAIRYQFLESKSDDSEAAA